MRGNLLNFLALIIISHEIIWGIRILLSSPILCSNILYLAPIHSLCCNLNHNNAAAAQAL